MLPFRPWYRYSSLSTAATVDPTAKLSLLQVPADVSGIRKYSIRFSKKKRGGGRVDKTPTLVVWHKGRQNSLWSRAAYTFHSAFCFHFYWYWSSIGPLATWRQQAAWKRHPSFTVRAPLEHNAAYLRVLFYIWILYFYIAFAFCFVHPRAGAHAAHEPPKT
jgi:hypothetical protein